MAWNEPGGGKDKDPWGGKNDQGPPDLDEVVKKMQEKVGGLFGGKKGSGGSSGPVLPKGVMQIGAIVIVGFWVAMGFFTIEQGKQGVITTFGAYSDTVEAGLQWVAVPFQMVQTVDIQKVHSKEVGYRSARTNRAGGGSVPKEAMMLTEDENIVDIRLAVQYKVGNSKDYLFNVYDPDAVLKQATESAIREVVGQNKMDYILKQGRAKVALDAQNMLQKILNDYHVGLQIVQVTMQDAQPPDEVQAAFTDAVKARGDKERYINEAEAYRRGILPKASGLAARKIEEATAYKLKVVAESTGEADRFSKILVEYEKAPEITRQRLYIEAMESVLTNTSKVLVDVEQGNSLMYLPLDKMMSNSNTNYSAPASMSATPSVNNRRHSTNVETTQQNRRTKIRGFQ